MFFFFFFFFFFFLGGGGGCGMVDAGPVSTYEEKIIVPPPLPLGLSISSNLSLLNAYKWAFVLVGFCPSGLLS